MDPALRRVRTGFVMEQWKRRFVGAAIGVGLLTVSGSAAAYTFDEDECAPRTEHTTGSLAPHVLMILDISISMDQTMASGDTRLETASTAISELVNDLERSGACPMDTSPECDPVRFGLGWFGDSSGTWVSPGEDKASAIDSALSMVSTLPGTQTEGAADELLNSPELQDDARPRAGVIITDGTPDWPSNAKAAVEKICDLRTRGTAPADTYIVGFGSDSNQEVNSFMAAAGGTGTCTDSTGAVVDPCDLVGTTALDDAFLDMGSIRTTYLDAEYTCTGSIEVTDGEAFKSELLTITEEFTCVLPLDIPDDYPGGAALADPEGTWVEIEHDTYGDFRIPYCPEGNMDCGLEAEMIDDGIDSATAAEYADEGWEWVDSGRTSVRVSDKLCEEIGARNIDTAYTQLACVCTLTGEECLVTIPGFNNEELERMRCSEGVYECVEDIDTCVAVADDNSLPEICNGIDDDCDGVVDNLSGAEEDWDAYPSADPEGKHCNFRDVCSCEDGGYDDPSIKTGDPATDIAAHLDSWSGTCTCGEGLGGPEPYTYGEPAGPTVDSEQTCTVGSAANVGASGLALLGLLGLLGFARRRRD